MFLKGGKEYNQARENARHYAIGEVSKAVNLSQKTIREYEQLGMFKPKRHPRTNNRIYSDFEVEQIKRITHLIHQEGFTLACIRRIIQLAPCWNIFECDVNKECPAYAYANQPCYEVRITHGTQCSGSCEHCAIFINRMPLKKRKSQGFPAKTQTA
ncbi:MerR family transcriptional regulator [Thermodesulfobacteriota bacterium]